MASPHGTSQAVYHAHMKLLGEQPAWMHMATEALNVWGRHEDTLQAAVARALMVAHQMGQDGATPAPPQAPRAPTVIRRTPPTITPQQRAVIRRAR